MFQIPFENINSPRLFSKAKLFIFPTDTLYGLGCSANEPESCEKIFNIKIRQKKKPLLVISNSIDKFIRLGIDISDELYKKLNQIWPASITVELPKKDPDSLKHLNEEGDTVMCRIPAKIDILNFLGHFKYPLVATSANYSGEKIFNGSREGFEDLLKQVDLFIDAGLIQQDELPSSILGLNEKGEYYEIREGAYGDTSKVLELLNEGKRSEISK